MPKKIYVGNLPFSATDDEVREFFEEFGPVISVKLITDRDTGRPRGFGFVEMDVDDIHSIIKATADLQMDGRALVIREAHRK